MFAENRTESDERDRRPFQAIDSSPSSSLIDCTTEKPAPSCNGAAAAAPGLGTPRAPDSRRRTAAGTGNSSKFKFILRQFGILLRSKAVGGAEQRPRARDRPQRCADEEAEHEGFLMAARSSKTDRKKAAGNGHGTNKPNRSADQRQASSGNGKAQLAKQETMEEAEPSKRRKQRRPKGSESVPSKGKGARNAGHSDSNESASSCFASMLKLTSRKRFYVPLLLLLVYIVAVYCAPYIRIEPGTLEPWPAVPFNYQEGPLKASSASQFKVEHLFKDQVYGAESVSLDASGNIFMAIEGGFVLYAHVNKSSPFKRHFLDASLQKAPASELPKLVKIAELNGIKQVPRSRAQRQDAAPSSGQTIWRRECQLDEQVYGQQLFAPAGQQDPRQDFKSFVKLSRCSKPLGTRLSPDENYLYVVDTMTGLFRVNLNKAERPYSSQRLVARLIDFRQSHVVPLVQLDQEATVERLQLPTGALRDELPQVNVTMRAIDDLVIDSGAGTRAGDLIYLTVASQNWPAVSFVFDVLEGRPSSLIMRYDTASNLLVALEPNRVAHVRTSANLGAAGQDLATQAALGAPRLDENDVFDDRPLHFSNGLELTDDRQAILIADTSNKRIIKHYIRGPRSGTSDLWAWTPNFPDNIRRGYDSTTETYWVVGCGRQESSLHVDPFAVMRPWPRLRKFVLKNIYLFGLLVEWLGSSVLESTSLADFGHSVRTGSLFPESGCTGLMVLQYNRDGELVRSVHSREFPNDLAYYSQANELIDANNAEHSLYLSSPSYSYVTKLTLPTESLGLSPSQPPPI